MAETGYKLMILCGRFFLRAFTESEVHVVYCASTLAFTGAWAELQALLAQQTEQRTSGWELAQAGRAAITGRLKLMAVSDRRETRDTNISL